MSLTDKVIKSLKPKAKPYYVYDGRGLILEVATSGSKLWRFRYQLHRKPHVHAFGRYPDVKLAEAREKCGDARKLVAAGVQLTHHKKTLKRRQEIEYYDTFEKYARKWFEQNSRHMNKKHAENTLMRLEKYVFPELGYLHPNKISTSDLVYVLEKIIECNLIETAKRVLQIKGQIFRHLKTKGVCKENPASDIRIKDITSQRKVEKHYASLHSKEFPALLQAMAARKQDVSSMAMELLALTFVRTSEIVGARLRSLLNTKGIKTLRKHCSLQSRP